MLGTPMPAVSPAESAGMTAGVARKTARSTGFGCGSAAVGDHRCLWSAKPTQATKNDRLRHQG